MKTKLIKAIILTIVCLFPTIIMAAKNYVTLSCDPDGAKVYLNGVEVAQTTPAVVEIPSKLVGKPLTFKFEKDGYVSKTVIVSYSKKEIKANPIVYCKMDKEETPVNPVYQNDKTIPAGQAEARVTRDAPGATSMERAIIRWYFDSDPRGARISYRVISNAPDEVKNTNETYLTTPPLEETKSFNILGLTYENSRNITIEIKVSKRGYEDQVKRYNVRQALDQQEISGFFELVPKEVVPEE